MNENNKVNLTLEELEYVQGEVENKSKKLSLTYLLALLLGPLGVHRAYIGKTKTAVVRAVVSLSTIFTIVAMVVNKDIVNMDVDLLTMEARAYSSMMMTLFLSLVAVGVLWTIYDLYSIPKWIREDVNELEKVATGEAIRSRYVSEHLKKKLLSKVLIEDITSDVTLNIKKDVDKVSDDINKVANDIKEDYSKLKRTSANYKKEAENVYSSLLDRANKSEIEIREQYEKLELSLHRALVNIDSEIMKEFLNEDLGIISNFNSDKDVIKARDKSLLPEEVVDENGLEPIPKSLSTIIDKDDSLPISIEEHNDVVSVAQAIKDNSGHKSVKGYIVGHVDPNSREIIKENANGDMNIAIADYPSESNQEVMLLAKLSWDSGLREKLGLKSNNDNLNKSIVITGELSEYFGKPGMTKVDKAYFL